MRVREFAVPLTLLGGIAAFIVVQSVEMSGQPRRGRAAAEVDAARDAGTAPAASDSTVTMSVEQSGSSRAHDEETRVSASSEPAPIRDTASINALIRDGSQGTYLSELIENQRGFLLRWPSRMNAIRVWIERYHVGPGWDARYPVAAERAFSEWQEAGFPLRFDVVLDSATSDIRIHWIDQFPEADGRRIGVTRNTRDQHWWLRAAEITIATHDREGDVLSPDLVAGTARHEVGHALGLGHSSSTGDVMHATAESWVISQADRRTLHLLYLLPPGRVK